MLKLINNNLNTCGIFRGKLLEDGDKVRVYIPGIHSNSLSDDVKIYPEIQWCCYNIESKDINNIEGPAFIMFENGDVTRPVCISYAVIGGYGSTDVSTDDSQYDSKLKNPKDMFIWPSATTIITSPYGNRIHPVTKRQRFHSGVDIGAPAGSNIFAAAAGKVTVSYDAGGYGHYVSIVHEKGYSTFYGHCKSVSVVTGDQVSQGDVIAICGSSGMSTGPHIHFEIRLNGKTTNPENYFES